MSKDLWIEAYERLEAELGREPTDEEIRVAYREAVERVVDYADYLRKAARENAD